MRVEEDCEGGGGSVRDERECEGRGGTGGWRREWRVEEGV